MGVIALVVAAAAACSSTGPAPATDAGAICPSDLPAACPAPPPSYRDRVSTIIESKCGPCHADGGVAVAGHDFTTYGDVYRQRSAVLNQVYGCVMPPRDAGALTAEERATLLGWLVCKAPND